MRDNALAQAFRGWMIRNQREQIAQSSWDRQCSIRYSATGTPRSNIQIYFLFQTLGSKSRRREMTESKSILTISRDQSLQSTRTFILEQEGYSVFAAVKDDDAVALVAANHNLSLVLMCHSVPEPSRVFLVNRINALNPKLPILILYNGYDITLAKVDGSLHSLESPQAMLEMISFMTKNIGTSAAVIYPEADRRTTAQAKSFKAGS